MDTTTPTNVKSNVEDGEIVRGNTLITGTIEGGHYEDLSLSLNDSVVETYPTVGTKAHFKFHGSKMNKGYQNAVTLGEDTLFLMDEAPSGRSEEHTSELQSRGHLVCRLLLEKK